MAGLVLADMKLLDRHAESVDTALHAIEKDMFDIGNEKQGHAADDVATDSLRYLFAIFR